MTDAPNQTIAAFGHPETLVKDYGPWVVLVRPAQPTLGSLVLASTEEVEAFSDLSDSAFAALPRAIKDIETALGSAFAYDKINYLMLMMVDPHVHYHVIPRYSATRSFNSQAFNDTGWPIAPNLGDAIGLDADGIAKLVKHLQSHWPK
jgi:diadenosine tetraphosphate (Ap4A) HIT family hydrolase